MRSVNRGLVAAAAVATLAGCGDYSTEDLRFLAALPTTADLKVDVPAQAAPAAGALSACGAGTAEIWLWAKPTSDGLNGAVSFVLRLVDLVRSQPPTWRDADARAWGPWDDRDHPGRELFVAIQRTWPPELAGAPRHAYVLEARVKGTTTWTPIIAGRFDGPSAERGQGLIALDFEAIYSLQMQGADTPHGKMIAQYDRGSTPVTIQLTLDQGGFGAVQQFAYEYAGWADGSGWFGYAFTNAQQTLFLVGAGFDAAGAGDANVGFRTAAASTGSFHECWDAGACLDFVDDPGNYSGACAAAPCLVGAASACPAVPARPTFPAFPPP
jgi:hypothetical protein